MSFLSSGRCCSCYYYQYAKGLFLSGLIGSTNDYLHTQQFICDVHVLVFRVETVSRSLFSPGGPAGPVVPSSLPHEGLVSCGNALSDGRPACSPLCACVSWAHCFPRSVSSTHNVCALCMARRRTLDKWRLDERLILQATLYTLNAYWLSFDPQSCRVPIRTKFRYATLLPWANIINLTAVVLGDWEQQVQWLRGITLGFSWFAPTWIVVMVADALAPKSKLAPGYQQPP